jgi:hypothetical protein
MKPLTVVCLFLAWPLGAQAAQVTMSASTQNATLAEQIELRVVVRADDSVESIRIDVPAGAYEIIGRRPRPQMRADGYKTFEEIITIAFFKTGDFSIGPFAVELLKHRQSAGEEQTGQLTIRIRSLLGENDRDIKPLKELLPIRGDPRHLLPYAAFIVLLILLAAMGRLLLKKMKKKRLPDAVPLPEPEIELEMRVQELRQKNLPQRGEFRQFFIVLSEMIKHFIQRAYGFNAKDCTSAETVAQLKDGEKDAAIVSDLGSIFTQADLVKFARRVPETEAVAEIFHKIAALIEKHKKRREAAAAEAHVQTGR